MKVIKSFNQLLEVEAGVLLLQFTTESNEIEQLTATDELEDNIPDGLAHILLRVGLLSFSNFNQVDNVGVFHLGKGIDLSFNEFLELFILVENFDGVASTGVILGKLDLAADSAAECSSECVFTAADPLYVRI
jgi:hypothetical protein